MRLFPILVLSLRLVRILQLIQLLLDDLDRKRDFTAEPQRVYLDIFLVLLMINPGVLELEDCIAGSQHTVFENLLNERFEELAIHKSGVLGELVLGSLLFLPCLCFFIPRPRLLLSFAAVEIGSFLQFGNEFIHQMGENRADSVDVLLLGLQDAIENFSGERVIAEEVDLFQLLLTLDLLLYHVPQ